MMRAPIRFVSISAMFFSIAIALGITKKSINWQYAIIVLVFFLQIPSQSVAMTEIKIPNYVWDLKQDQREYSILHSPVFYRHKQTYMMWQTVHEHPISTGYTARKWKDTGRYFRSIEAESNIKSYFAIENAKRVSIDGFGLWVQHDSRIEDLQKYPQICVFRWPYK